MSSGATAPPAGGSRVQRWARLVFALLILATLGGFFVAQKLKSSPPVLLLPGFTDRSFSPNGDGLKDKMQVSFFLRRSDDVTVQIVNEEGDVVREIASGRPGGTDQRLFYTWDGKDENGARAPDGDYQVRIFLTHQGRTVTLQRRIHLDTKPLRPVVTSVTPALYPAPGQGPPLVAFGGTNGRGGNLLVWRTDTARPHQVAQVPFPHGAGQVRWDARVGGRPAPPGTYVMRLLVFDPAGNPGSFPRVVPPPRGQRAPGHAGFTIRALAAQPPLTAVPAGGKATILVDSRRQPFTWSLRRAGTSRTLADGSGSPPGLRVRLPKRVPGLYIVTIESGSHRTSVPVVASARPRRVAQRPRVLVVLPALTWQAQNPVDDDGDGFPNTLAAGGPVALQRVLATGLPADVPATAAPLLRFLDQNHLGYDVTTDLGLLAGTGPRLGTHRGVVLAGDETWTPPQLAVALRRYVNGGGRVWNLGTDSLRRTVRLRGDELSTPGPLRRTDALGARPKRLVHPARPQDLLSLEASDAIGLFNGTGGQFSAVRAYQPLAGVAAPAQLVSAAGPDSSVPVLVGYRLGQGLVIRTGIPSWPKRLAGDLSTQDETRRIWAILRGG